MSLYKINPKYSLILKTNDQLLVAKDNKYKVYEITEEEVSQTKEFMRKEMFEKQNTKIFQKLISMNVLIKCTNVESNRNTHSYLEVYTNSKISMENLKNKKVFIIGLGGIGREIITHLVGNGVKKLVIYICLTNLHTHFFML